VNIVDQSSGCEGARRGRLSQSHPFLATPEDLAHGKSYDCSASTWVQGCLMLQS